MQLRRRRFEMKYDIIITYDSGREIMMNSFNFTEAETRAKEWAKRKEIKSVEIRRQESFLVKRYVATEERYA